MTLTAHSHSHITSSPILFNNLRVNTEKQVAADQAKARFAHSDGDHLALLKVYEAWEENSCSESWCYDNYINAKTMNTAQVISSRNTFI